MLRTSCCVFSLAVFIAPPGAGQITFDSLIDDLTNLERFAEFPAPAYVTRQSSSYDRASTSPAQGDAWFANNDRGQYLRVESRGDRTEYVMLDAEGPGALVRIWSANPEGAIRIYIDGSEKPVLEAPAGDLLRGKVAPFVPPLAHEVSRGCNLYFPFPYAKRCKVTVDAGGLYYHVSYRTYAPGTAVESYSPEALARARAAIGGAVEGLSAPAKPAVSGARHERAEIRVSTAKAKGSGPQRIAASPGGSVIRELALRPSKTDPEILRGTLLILRFDGEEAVLAPLGDFFGTGPGLNAYESLPFSVSRDGTLTCRWPMPFREGVVIALGSVAGDVDVAGYAIHEPRQWTDASLHFHAKWRAEHGMTTEPPRDWNFVEVDGRGRYVGNLLDVANPVRAWWGEGDEKIYVDGEPFPSHFGTGTEDYYGYAWSSPDLFTHAFHNQTRCDGPGTAGHTSVNRWHVIDDIPFEKKLRFDLEVWHWDRKIKVSHGAVSYWYARPGSRDNVGKQGSEAFRIPLLPEHRQKVVKDSIEGESLKVLEMTGPGVASPQDMSPFGEHWSRDAHLWWRGAKQGNRLVLGFDAPRTGRYRVTAQLTKAVDYGVHQLSVNGVKAGKPADLWNDGVIPADPLDLGVFDLTAAGNRLTVEITGTNDLARPRSYMFGLDYIRLKAEGE